MMQNTSKHYAYMDFLRVLACFLVIVNHTNSRVFQHSTPEELTWFCSMAWYYVCKVAVPLFLMITGACLLPKQDSYRRTMGRFGRIVLVTVLFSYLYYVVDGFTRNRVWQQALAPMAFLRAVWAGSLSDGLWYLYFYAGLMLTLPLWQRMTANMGKKDLLYLMGICFGAKALWPLLEHYHSNWLLNGYFDVSVMSSLVGLLFAGHYVQRYVQPKRWHGWACGAVIAACVAIQVWLTLREYAIVEPGEPYWFMDKRDAPGLFMLISAIAAMIWAKSAFDSASACASRLWQTLGGCAFGVYLLQDLLIAKTSYTLFPALCTRLNPFLAALVWEAAVFAAALPIAWALKKIPGLKKLL
ncbi:MAG: acyltransferase [Eubacteriales bacterium]|nr:acyltransferase [Eubacteriales bacterium]